MSRANAANQLNISPARTALIERSFHAAAPVLLPWFGESVLRASLADELDRDLDCVEENPSAASSDTNPKSFFRLIRLPGNPAHWVVAQLVHEPDAAPSTHVLIKHRTVDANRIADVEMLKATVKETFANEQPDRICIRRFESDADPIGPDASLRTGFIAAPLRHLHWPAGMERIHELRAERPSSLAFYDTYESWYNEFWKRRPELVSHVPIETRGDLKRCMEDDGVRLIYLGDELCGLLAAMRLVQFGLKGWRMREKVIAPAFWGRGLAAPATVIFAQSLTCEPDDAIWGTIVPGNRASMRSAERIGRRTIGSLYWL